MNCQSPGKAVQVALDHIRSVEKTRLVRRLGVLEAATAQEVVARLVEMCAY